MNDRELLELAAKAAGIKIDKSPYNGGGCGNTGFDLLGNAILDWHNNVRWNPLKYDGDAFRLAMILRMRIIPGKNKGDGYKIESMRKDGVYIIVFSHSDDFMMDMRKAIVGEAAEIGKAMK